MVRTAPAALVSLLVLATSSASAQSPTRFEYQRDDSAVDCPDAAALRRGVAARLGFEPFSSPGSSPSSSGTSAIHVAVARVSGQLRAQISVRDGAGGEVGSRVLLSRAEQCNELAASIELAIAIAIDPLHDGQTAAPAAAPEAIPEREATAAEPISAPASPLSPPSSAVVSKAAPEPWTPLFGVGFVFAPSSAPEPTGGVSAQIHLRKPRYVLGLEARYDVPAATAAASGSVRAGLMLATSVLCLRFGFADACALAEAGLLRASGERFDENHSTATPHAAGGMRLAASLPLADRLSLQLHADVTVPVSRTTLAVDDMNVWSTPDVAAVFGSRVRWESP